MASSAETYKNFAEYYDLYIRNYSEDLMFYLSLCSKKDQIVEIGCGTGRILQYFLDNGFNITGIDISVEMLNKARQKLINYINNGNLKLLEHDFSIHSLTEKFDIGLITFYTFNYILDQPEIFLFNLYNSLNPNSLIAIDLFYPTALSNPSVQNQWIEKEFTFDERFVRIRDKRKIKNNIENRIQIYIEDNKETHIETERRYYAPNEIYNLLKNAGFRDIEFSAVYDNSRFVSTINEYDLHKNYLVKARK